MYLSYYQDQFNWESPIKGLHQMSDPFSDIDMEWISINLRAYWILRWRSTQSELSHYSIYEMVHSFINESSISQFNIWSTPLIEYWTNPSHWVSYSQYWVNWLYESIRLSQNDSISIQNERYPDPESINWREWTVSSQWWVGYSLNHSTSSMDLSIE